MVETTTGWLETYPVPHATDRNTILGLEKQVLWRHGTPERIESDNGTHFRKNLIDTWAKEHGIEWVYHIPYHAPASGKIERYNGLLKTTLRAMGARQIDSITLPQTCQGKRHVLTMVEATTGWLEIYPVPYATTRNTILGLEKQVLWQHDTPERIESDNGTHFQNNLIDTWAKEHGIEWVYHIPYHAPASGKIERYNGLLKTTL
ncbi:hypothetical protein QYF61_004255 [Mycteria americana]|uniref:Integrase catalytic domain-containing protein n=1 Tax=Mycteria americana TaxID=33587 RepID=A0AAN7N866_MYCAM|nr:hypothetical protein QYF61_004255 [Mycteria americana]